ncbi:MAG TPA: hypothetical protein VMI31_03645 [Fimbriimonadaceae bacterium]|nr:hypothetical protein [Fimbriimonadaceae bacterium]
MIQFPAFETRKAALPSHQSELPLSSAPTVETEPVDRSTESSALALESPMSLTVPVATKIRVPSALGAIPSEYTSTSRPLMGGAELDWLPAPAPPHPARHRAQIPSTDNFTLQLSAILPGS